MDCTLYSGPWILLLMRIIFVWSGGGEGHPMHWHSFGQNAALIMVWIADQEVATYFVLV